MITIFIINVVNCPISLDDAFVIIFVNIHRVQPIEML